MTKGLSLFSWGLGLLLLLGSAPPGFSYWVHKTSRLKGKRHIVVRDSVRYLYVRISARHPAQWTLKRGKSVKLRLENLSKKGPARVRLLRQGKEFKSWTVKKRREIKIHLPPGTYRLESQRPVRVRYYEWRKPQLRRVVPLTGGFPATLQVKTKRTTYYWVTPDSPVVFRVRGPARVWFYFRGITGQTPTFQVWEGDSLLFHIRNRWKPSHRARILEDTTLRLTRPRKRFLKVPEGEHEYQVRTQGGRGLVKLYREVRSKKTRTQRRIPSRRERLLRAPRGELWMLPYLWASPGQRHPWRFSVQGQWAYLSNPFTFAEEDLQRIREGTAPYRYPDVHAPTDLRLRVRAFLRWYPGDFRWRSTVTLYGHLRNPVKNRTALRLEVSRRRSPWTIGFSWRPQVYVRPVYRSRVQRTDPLQYTALAVDLKVQGRRQRNRGALILRWQRFAYQAPFSYLSGHRWELQAEARIPGYRLGGTLGLLVTDAQPWEPDASYWLLAGYGEFPLPRQARAFGRLAWKTYLTPQADDDLHYGRRDLETRLRVTVPLVAPVGTLYWFLAYTGRRVWVDQNPHDLVFKNYDAWSTGLTWSSPVFRW